MLRILYSLITISVIISNPPNNQILLDILKDNNHWVVINSRADSIQVYEKNIPNMELNALKVEKVISFKRDLIENIIMDINKYPNIMSNEDMISLNLGEGNNIIFGYNHFSFPFPLINDRHYFFKLIKESKTTISWTLLSKQEVNSSRKLISTLNNQPNAVYIEYGAGLWKLEPISDNLSKISYSLYMDSGGHLSSDLNDFFNSQSIITLFKSVLKKAGESK